MDWQPIETAPKGQRILVSDGTKVGIASYREDKGQRLIPDYPKPYWEDFDNSFWETEGEWLDAKWWQPLPDPPTVVTQGERS